jgi:hypothetical protein
MNKKLIIGLDLSFSSTGITITYLEDFIAKKIQFHKVVFDENQNKTNKKYTPQKIKNVNILTYRMPTNILVGDIILDFSDTNNIEQCTATIKALICSKKIGNIIINAANLYKVDEIIFSIENYIMPNFSGSNQLKTVSGLIMLQGYVREIIIKLCLELKISFKLFTPTPSNNKKFFTNNGSAEKQLMLNVFLEHYDGNKLLPSIDKNSVSIINDVIDSFSLMSQAYSKIIKNN